MEKGGCFDSDDECRDRRKGGLPLSVFLAFNDRDVHPRCPNASNPYHKCGRYCFDKIPSLNELLVEERSGGSCSEWEKTGRKVVTSCCPKAANPYHKCAEYCFVSFDKIKREDVVKTPVMKQEEQEKVHIANRGVSPNCKYATNPYHVCAEYCFKEVSQPDQGMKIKSPKETQKMVKNTEITGVNPRCRYASNPYHKCAEYCFQNVEERDKFDGALIKEKNGDPRTGRRADHPIKEKSSIEASNTNHNHVDPSKGFSMHVGTTESNSVLIKEEKEEETMAELLDTQPLRIDASDLFKEWAKYCSLKAIEDSKTI